jgi:ribonuclease HI
MAPGTKVYNLVHYYLAEFEKLCKEKPSSSVPNRPIWRPPPLEYYEINADASFYPDTGHGGWGFVARDCDGNFLEGGAGNISRCAGVVQAEAIAAIKSLERVVDLGMTRIILETDARVLGEALRTTAMDRSPNGGLFRRIRDMMYNEFVSCFMSVVPRSCNFVADCLASHGTNDLSAGLQVFTSHTPDFVLALVSRDLPSCSV